MHIICSCGTFEKRKTSQDQEGKIEREIIHLNKLRIEFQQCMSLLNGPIKKKVSVISFTRVKETRKYFGLVFWEKLLKPVAMVFLACIVEKFYP